MEPEGAPHSLYGDDVCPENDLYCQEFFLHAYAVLSRAKSEFIESKEGFTYMKATTQAKLSRHVISLIRGPSGNIKKWEYKMAQLLKKITVDGVKTEYIDVDQILYGAVSEFRNQRGAFQKSLEKEFIGIFETYTQAAAVSFDQFNQMVENISMGKNNDDTHDPLIQYPGELSKIRAFIFSLTAGERNDAAFNAANFCAGLTRYGVECPVPCVSMRCQLYGNPKYIMDRLREAEEKYGKYKIKVHMKRYSEREENKRQ